MSAMPQETAKQAAQRLARAAIKGEFTAEALHVYCDAEGQPVYWRWRARKADGEKVIRPMHWNGSAFVAGEPLAPTTGKLLYRLPELLAADAVAVVLIVEGERCADHLHRLGLTVTTSGGAASANGADWTPLRGRHCLLWPDHDEPGSKYADDVTHKLLALGCTVERIDVAALDLPEKGDVVDWLVMHPDATAADVLTLSKVEANRQLVPIDDSPRVVLIRGSDVQPEAVQWLWDGWLANGKLHLIGGAPGTGKTTIAASLAAIITSGGRWPDGTRAKTGSVVFWSGEDDVTDTLAPRLLAAGADMRKVHMVGGVREGMARYPFDPALHMDALRAALATVPDVRLIVVDPIVSAITGDSHKNAEVRRGLQPLVDLGMQLHAAVLGVTHFSKGTSGRDPVERITGSLAFAALARLVIVTAKQEAEGEREERRLLLRAKSNISADGGGFVYDLQQGDLQSFPGVSASSVLWGEAIHGTARDLLAEAEQRDDDHTRDAVEFLRDLLACGAVAAKDIYREAENAGYSRDAMKRAKTRLGVQTTKTGMNGGWVWRLPNAEASRNPAEGSEGSGQKSLLPSLPSEPWPLPSEEEREGFTL
jgi:putative DNA primase/helicase